MSPRAKRNSSADITVTFRVAAGLSAGRVRAWAQAARRRLPQRPGHLSIVFVGPVASRRLNRQYRGKDRATNVLSWLWPKNGQPRGEEEWGEIVLCPAVIRREAPAYERPYAQHVQRLIEHGLIHLLGFDHETPAEVRRWQRYERRLP